MSNGGPGIISDNAERAPSTLATAITRVSIFRKDTSPAEKVLLALNHIYILRKIICIYRNIILLLASFSWQRE